MFLLIQVSFVSSLSSQLSVVFSSDFVSISRCFFLVNNFFYFFKYFSFYIQNQKHNKRKNSLFYRTLKLTNFYSRIQLTSFYTNGEGGIWTLAPLLTTYSLSRGAPSASWVLLQKTISPFHLIQNPFNSEKNKTTKWLMVLLSSGEGGIRTHVSLRTNGFQDRLVMASSIPLRNLLP